MDSTCQNRAKLNNIALCKRSPNPHLTEIQIVTVLKNLNICLYFYAKNSVIYYQTRTFWQKKMSQVLSLGPFIIF